MKITAGPGAGHAGAVPVNTPGKPRKRFSEELKPEGRQSQEEAGRDDGVAQAAAQMQPAPLPHPASVDAGHEAAAPGNPLLASLVREVTVAAPPAGGASVDIQFDSRTFEGLHVRIQKSGDSVHVRFATSSGAVSRLLEANAHTLSEALAQRGYAAPTVTVQRVEPGSAASPGGDSRRSGRGGGNRGGSGDGRGRNRR
jgi:hypothetical protein